MEKYEFILVDRPAEFVNRITLNRPDKRNALNNKLRGEIIDCLTKADLDDSVRVTIIRGSGKAFSAGYDLGSDLSQGQPFHTAQGLGFWPRQVTEGWMRIMDLAKPVIAQVHGYCLAGGSELATSCDLVYVGDSTRFGYPATRSISPPDMQFHPWLVGMRASMELMLTGDSVTGEEAVKLGFANRLFPDDSLDEEVLKQAERVAKIPPDIQQINKRSVHRAMEIMGMRAALRSGTEMQALAEQTASSIAFGEALAQSVTGAFQNRDEKFGDGRTVKDS